MLSNTINEIHGVSKYLINDAVKIKFRQPLSIESWHILLKNIHELLERGLLHWEFDLTELHNPCSTDIGMWVTCVSRITPKSGKINFIVKKDSHAHILLKATRLMEIYDVVLVN